MSGGGWGDESESDAASDVVLDVDGWQSAIDFDDASLAAEQVEDRFGLGVVSLEPVAQSGFVVVGASDESTAADIAGVERFGAMVDEVVVEAAAAAEPASQNALADDFVGDDQVEHGADVKVLEEKLGLWHVPRESVEDKAEVPVVFVEPAANDLIDHFVADQPARSDQLLDVRTKLGVVLDVPAEDITDADMDQIEIFAQHSGLGSFAAALNAHDDVFVHAESALSASVDGAAHPLRIITDRPAAGKGADRRGLDYGRLSGSLPERVEAARHTFRSTPFETLRPEPSSIMVLTIPG